MAAGSSINVPPVGKSGPGMWASRSAVLASGLAIRWMAASHTSPALCGGMLVAMPTAMPAAPLASRFGNAPGSTVGSFSTPSYVGRKSTASSSMPARRVCATSVSRASV